MNRGGESRSRGPAYFHSAVGLATGRGAALALDAASSALRLRPLSSRCGSGTTLGGSPPSRGTPDVIIVGACPFGSRGRASNVHEKCPAGQSYRDSSSKVRPSMGAPGSSSAIFGLTAAITPPPASISYKF